MRRQDLPLKICAQCDRPFAWRRKWQRDWEEVRYCSKRCRGQARGRLCKGNSMSVGTQ